MCSCRCCVCVLVLLFCTCISYNLIVPVWLTFSLLSSSFGQFTGKLLKIGMLRYFQQILSLLYLGQVFLLLGYVFYLFNSDPAFLKSTSHIVVHFFIGWLIDGTGSIFGWFVVSRNRVLLAGWVGYCSLPWPSVRSILYDGEGSEDNLTRY